LGKVLEKFYRKLPTTLSNESIIGEDVYKFKIVTTKKGSPSPLAFFNSKKVSFFIL